jgi:hypothetical protein
MSATTNIDTLSVMRKGDDDGYHFAMLGSVGRPARLCETSNLQASGDYRRYVNESSGSFQHCVRFEIPTLSDR